MRAFTFKILRKIKSDAVTIIEFQSIENARKFYGSENYTAARAVRELAADNDLILVDGL